MKNIVLFGPPGAGKGTQSEKLIAKYDFTHLSTGDLLRAEKSAGTELGNKAKEYMDSGKLVPDELVIGIIESRITPESKGFIFDGFPRTVAQAEALDVMLEKNGISISRCIALEVDEEELTQRILDRGKKAENPRPDDLNEDLIRTRVKEYYSKTAPVADYYDSKGKLSKIQGVGSIEEIFENLSAEVDKL